MTKEEILAMKSGKKLNIKVAEAVMGHEVIVDEIFGDSERYIDKDGKSAYAPLQAYSEEVSAARLVLEKIIGLGHNDATSWKHQGKEDHTWAEAICKVALLAVLAKEDNFNDE